MSCFTIIVSKSYIKIISIVILCAFIFHIIHYIYQLNKRLKFDKLELTSDITCAKGDGTWLSNSANLNLFKILKTFGNLSNFHFVEVGCGKGGVLYLVAAYFNFNKITGIERDLDGIKVCKNNLRKYRHIEIICEDASKLSLSLTMNFYYFSNPFGEETFNIFINKIISSYEKNPRDIYILYRFPTQHNLLIYNNFKLMNTFILKKLQGKRHWHYESMPGTEVNYYKFDRKSYK